MITFEEFYRTIGDLHVGQEAHVYSEDDKTPFVIFKKCEEFGEQFVLVRDLQSCEFGIVQDTTAMSFSASLMGFFDDMCNNCDDLIVEVKNREFFTISEVSRDDLESQGFEVSNVDDATMDELADRLGEDYCEQLFWISLEIIAEEGLNIPRNCEDEEDEES